MNRLTLRRVLLPSAASFCLLAGAEAASITGDALDEHVFLLARNYFAEFQHPETGILYGARLSGKDKWTSPNDVKEGKPVPWGYGSRIADTSLHTGHMLVAMLDAHDARPDPFLRDQIRILFDAMKRIGSLPEKFPKPGKPALEGLVPRGPHPDDMTAYYDDSSMDQHTTYIISLAIYANSPLATPDDKEWIRKSLGKIGRRLEENDWRILRADGITEAHVGFSWKGFNSNHASILLPTVLALYRGTEDGHWLEVYEEFIGEKDRERWKKLHPGPHVGINGHPIYANQNAFRVNAHHRFEDDAERQSVLRGLLKQSVTLQMERDFPGDFYRKRDTDGRWERVRREFGWKDAELRGCVEAWDGFDASMLDHDDAGLAALAHVRFPLGGYHMVLLSEDPAMIREHVASVWRMLSTVDLGKIDAGETHYLFTVVGLHLYAEFHRHPERFAVSTAAASGSSNSYGKELEIARNAGTGPVIDVAVEGERAFAIGTAALHVLDISDRARPRTVSKLTGLGNVRQIAVRDSVAYITSREDGLFIVDVANPAKPRLINHYDTIEFATGIALSGDVLFVACRNFGVELIDVSNPGNPRHLSTVRTGEAQSVTARDHFLYAGVWASSEIVVVDVRDPLKPVIVDRVHLDGYGDGVAVVGDYLYAATGHHSKSVAYRNPGDPGYGRGHGLEVLDLSDPAHPVFVSRVKFPPFYHIGNDTWRVTVANGHAFVADTHNGMFVVDVKDPRSPRIVSRLQLPYIESRKSHGFVGGLAPVEDHVYIAGGNTDLHVVDLPGIARDAEGGPGKTLSVDGLDLENRDANEKWRAYRPGSQVYSVDFLADDHALIACGSGGVHLVELWPEFRRISVLETEGFAFDVCVSGERVLVAEGTGGLSLCRLSKNGTALERLNRYRVKGKAVRQVESPPPGSLALVQAGSNRFHIVDIQDPASPKKLLEDTRHGLLYGDQMMRGLVEDRYTCVFWHVSGLHWYDLGDDAAPVFSGDNFAQRIGSKNGLVSFRDKTLATVRGGFILLDRSERRPLDEVPIFRVGKKSGHLGTPNIDRDQLIAADRSTGIVTVADISDPEKPKLIDQFTTPGNPGRPVFRKGALIVPDGYNGLLVLDK